MATLLKRRADTNVSIPERWFSMLAGAGLAAYGLSRRNTGGVALAAIGGAFAWRGATGHCDMYQALGINTSERGYAKGTGSKAGVPYELGVRVDQEITIHKPAAELYRFWRNLENLPRFMSNVECVKQLGDGRSHWVVKGPAGLRVEWDAEIVNDVENQVIGWRSLPGSQVSTGGSVRFEQTEAGSTAVRVSLQYNPPAGGLGARVSKLLGEDPARMIQQDLETFRDLMEKGSVSMAGKPGASTSFGDKRDRWSKDTVQQASEESFPASDSPSWTPEKV